MAIISVSELESLAARALATHGASSESSESTARALVNADVLGLSSHGVSRIPQYISHLRYGRVDGRARPEIVHSRGAAFLIDAHDGFAYPALALAGEEAIRRVGEQGIVLAGVRNSHHFGAAAYHLERVGKAGLVGFLFGNSPAAIPAWGGKRALFGTNPVAAIFPRQTSAPLVIDLSLSEVARGKLMVAAREGKSIPIGWALDKHGHPTTDPQEGLQGMMCAAGGLKGTMLAMMIELLCCALTGAAFGFEADSFFVEAGNRPRLGQALIVIDPEALSGRATYYSRMDVLIESMLQDDEVRLPGQNRDFLRDRAARDGVDISDKLLAELVVLSDS